MDLTDFGDVTISKGTMERYYEHEIRRHFAENRQMLFIQGPRQSGKTTTARQSLPGAVYLNWDDPAHRSLIRGPRDHLGEFLGLATLSGGKRSVVFDELHKYSRWQNFLKGFFDSYGERISVLVTGSARLGVFKRGGDSLAGRYFTLRHHPLTLGEWVHPGGTLPEDGLFPPSGNQQATLKKILDFGGFPELLTRKDPRFSNRWRALRQEQLLKEDLRDLTSVREMDQVEYLATLVTARAGQATPYSQYAKEIQVSVDTIRRWFSLLEALFICFPVRPWSTNIAKSLRKEPRYYLWDHGAVSDRGFRLENLVACHLLKSVHAWTDLGLGAFGLHYLRDKTGREVDFLVTRDKKPWFLVEVKSGDVPLGKSLSYFQKATGARHAFQATLDIKSAGLDVFSTKEPMKVSMADLLVRLV